MQSSYPRSFKFNSKAGRQADRSWPVCIAELRMNNRKRAQQQQWQQWQEEEMGVPECACVFTIDRSCPSTLLHRVLLLLLLLRLKISFLFSVMALSWAQSWTRYTRPETGERECAEWRLDEERKRWERERVIDKENSLFPFSLQP